MRRSRRITSYAKEYAKSLLDPVSFATRILGFEPYPYQEPFLRDPASRIAACCARQVGKTTLTAIKALHEALSEDDRRILIVSATLRQSIILFEKIIEFTEKPPAIKIQLTHQTKTRLRFVNRSEILALPCGRDGATLRGYTADMIILDEANFIPPIVIDAVVKPMLITRPHARLIMLSTPWVKDHPFHQALTDPDHEYGTYTWRTSLNPTVTPERLEHERRTIGEQDYQREYEAVFLDSQFSYFPSQLVQGCTDSYPLYKEDGTSTIDGSSGIKPDAYYYLGVDFGKQRDHSATAIIEKTRQKHLRLVYLREFPLETEYSEVIGAISRLNDAYKFASGYIDESGVGEGPYELIRKSTPAIKGITLTLQAKQEILTRLKLSMERREITIPGDAQRLLNQLVSQEAHLTIYGNQTFRHPEGSHDDQLWALALAAYSASKHQPGIFSAAMLVGARRQR